MSHFIEGFNLHPHTALDHSPLKKIVAPRFQHILKDSGSKFNNTWKQELAISNLCKKLNDREYALLRKQNASQIEHYFAKLKQKLKRQAQTNSQSVWKRFEGFKQSHNLNVKQMIREMPVKIDLVQKYNSKFINSAEMIHNTKKINEEKQRYIKWLDHEKNSPTKSPNYNKMSFVLEKLHKAQNRILSQNKLSKLPTNQTSFIVRTQHQGYTSNRRLKTHSSQSTLALKQLKC